MDVDDDYEHMDFGPTRNASIPFLLSKPPERGILYQSGYSAID